MERSTNRVGTSVLFALPVRGVGTGEVESLTSYLRRLAEAHVTNPSWLASSIDTADSMSASGRRRRNNEPTVMSNRLCGSSQTTRKLVRSLIEQTWVADMAHTVMLDRTDGVVLQRVFRKHRAWCPPCLASGQPYDR